jgi:hypothetical protein
MKITYTFLLFLSTFSVVGQQTELLPKNSRILFYELPNTTNIKAAGITSDKKYMKFRNSPSDSLLMVAKYYDKNGNLISKTDYSGATAIHQTFSYTLRDNGQIKELSFTTTPAIQQVASTRITYNEGGQEQSKYEYDEENNLLSLLVKNYDEAGRCISVHFKKEDNQFQVWKTHEYNTNGQLIYTKVYSGNSNIPVTIFKYTQFKNKESVTIIENEAYKLAATYIYDKNGACIKAEINERFYSSSSPNRFDDMPVVRIDSRDNRTQQDEVLPNSSAQLASALNAQNFIALQGSSSQSTVGANTVSTSVIPPVGNTSYYKTTFNWEYNNMGLIVREQTFKISKNLPITSLHYFNQ